MLSQLLPGRWFRYMSTVVFAQRYHDQISSIFRLLDFRRRRSPTLAQAFKHKTLLAQKQHTWQLGLYLENRPLSLFATLGLLSNFGVVVKVFLIKTVLKLSLTTSRATSYAAHIAWDLCATPLILTCHFGLVQHKHTYRNLNGGPFEARVGLRYQNV